MGAVCHTASPVAEEIKEADQGQAEDKGMFRPQRAVMQHCPRERDDKMHTVAPFYLQGIEYEMDKAVACKYHQYLAGLLGAAGQGRRQEKAEQEAGLSCTVETQVVRVKHFQWQEACQNDPRQIGKDAGNNYPEQPLSSEHHPVERGLKTYVTECVRQRKEEDR